MSTLADPIILEVNTWTWLQKWSQRLKTGVTLANLPLDRLDDDLRYFDALWLMGVWERSPTGREIALNHPDLRSQYQNVLNDFRSEDVIGSPYSVRDYRVEEKLGGEWGLAAARKRLAERGIRLILDFVPNHVARDHGWVRSSPSLLVAGTGNDVDAHPERFFRDGESVFAHGRDPYFPPWTDTAQVNIFSPQAREELVRILLKTAERCDGLRCDMAMLVTNDVFARTWGDRVGPPPNEEFWQEGIVAVKERFPDFIFIAEVYWGMERELHKQGFDYCYDKLLYDRMAHEDAGSVRAHLSTPPEFQSKLVRFIENHDELRAPIVFGERHRAASILALTLPGAKLVHEGQTRGHRIRSPVQLARRPPEPDDLPTVDFYRRLLTVTSNPDFRKGVWCPCELIPAADENVTNLISYIWKSETSQHLVVVNFGAEPFRGRVKIARERFGGRRWTLADKMADRTQTVNGDELDRQGIPFEPKGWDGQIIRIQQVT